MSEYSRRAWASAEASAWESLRLSAEAIDIADRAATAGRNRGLATAASDLSTAREAIREARDFTGKYGVLDAEGVERIVLSHTTKVLKNESLRNVPPTDATDRYLNEARTRLGRLAKFSPEAAQAMDLIAAIYLSRGDKQTLPSQTALCLRRAALQGQPGNPSLAERLGMHLASLGLDVEAKWALEQAMSVRPSQEASETLQLVEQRAGNRAEAIQFATRMRTRLPAGYDQGRGPAPQVVQLTPREFASVSTQVMPPGSINAAAVSHRVQSAGTAGQVQNKFPNMQTSLIQTEAGGAIFQDQSQFKDLVVPPNFLPQKPKSSVQKLIDTAKFWK